MVDIGYDSYNPIHNLGSLGFYVVVYGIKLSLLLVIIFPINKATGYLSDTKKSMWNAVFFNDILIIFVEGFIEFTLSTFLLYDAPPDHNDRDAFTISVVGFIFICSNIIIPCLMLWILLTKDLKTINDEKFKAKWDSLYLNARSHSKV